MATPRGSRPPSAPLKEVFTPTPPSTHTHILLLSQGINYSITIRFRDFKERIQIFEKGLFSKILKIVETRNEPFIELSLYPLAPNPYTYLITIPRNKPFYYKCILDISKK
jgi:hypothetical protein